MSDQDSWETILEVYATNAAVPIKVKYGVRRSRPITRGLGFLEAVAEAAGLDRETLEERVDVDERADDLVRAAGQAAVLSSDERYRRTLANLVGKALLDDTKIDENELVIQWVRELSPAHLRILGQFLVDHPNVTDRDQAQHRSSLMLSPRALDNLGMTYLVASVVVGELVNRGMAVANENRTNEGIELPTITWSLTPIGFDVVVAGRPSPETL